MEEIALSPFRIGTWTVQPGLNRLCHGDHVIALEPKVMEVLVVLAQHMDEVVTRKHLMETVWPNLVVTEEALTRCISALRSAFQDDYQNPQVIETIRKTGYRLIAPVSWQETTVSAPKVAILPTAPTRLRWPWAFGLLAVFSLALLGAFAWWSTPSASPSLQIMPLTSYVGNEMQPAFSPDGNHIAFAWDDRDGTHLDIHVRALQAETPLQVTSDSAYEVSPTWSPDGTHLAFARVWGSCKILTIPVLGGPERKLADCGGWGNPELHWSPNPETQLVAISETPSRHEPRRLLLLSLETLEKTQLTFPSSPQVHDRLPRFSPDGKTVAFVRIENQTSDLYLIPTSGGTPKRLTFDNHEIGGLAWASDGRHVLFSSNRSGTYSLWQVSVQGGTPTLVLASGEALLRPDLASSDALIAYEQWSNETNIYRLSLQASGQTIPQRHIASTRWDAKPQFDPTGSRIAFISTRSGEKEIWISRADGTHPFQLTTLESTLFDHPRWSPDGKQIAFDAHVAGNTDLYLMDASGGQTHRLSTTSAIDRAPFWAPDGQWIYFESDRGGTWQIWKQAATGGDAVQVTTMGGRNPQVSPDGSLLYYVKDDTTGIWQMTLRRKEERQITDQLPPRHLENWSITSDGVYFVRFEQDAGMILAFFDLANETVSDITILPKLTQNSGLTLSPDGQWLLYAQLDRSESDLMLVNGWR